MGTIGIQKEKLLDLVILKYKDLKVATVQINTDNGFIEHVQKFYLPEEFPIGCKCFQVLPSSSITGNIKKKWMIKNGVRYLVKTSAND